MNTSTKRGHFRPDATFILSNAYRTEGSGRHCRVPQERHRFRAEKQEDAKAKAEEYTIASSSCAKFPNGFARARIRPRLHQYDGRRYFTRKRDDLLQRFAGYENGVMNPEKGYVNNPGLFKSPAMPAAHYFSGLALLAMGKFEEAKPLLGAIVGASVSGLPVKDLDQIAEAADAAGGADPSDDTNPEEVPGG